MKKLWLAMLCLIGLTQCKNKIYTLDNLPKQYIEIGSYGGFTGLAKTYYFFPNGQKMMNSALPGDTAANGVEISATDNAQNFKQMVKGLKAMNFCDMELNEPGNMNYFIRLKTKKEDKKLLWNNMDTAPKELVSFYRNTIKNLNTAAIK